MESNALRQLPSVDKLLSDERIDNLTKTFRREVVVGLIRECLASIRREIAQGAPAPSFDDVVDVVVKRADRLENPSLKPLINATGVVLHTNLGRAPMSEDAIRAMDVIAGRYNSLEYDLATGKRGTRQVHFEPILCELTGAEAAFVVNNNAAAVLLAMSAIAKGKEVIVSRGQGVQIGGGFRIPEVMQQGGAKLVEVGTTNCTYIEDYELAITPKTAALLRVHSSNFKITGFTHSVPIGELVTLGNKHNLPVLDDLGSGALFDTAKYGLDPEPTVQNSVAAGASLIMFSGDKLLGGPQAGIILGKKDFIRRLERHPLARALRIDKVRIAGLTATLLHYFKGDAVNKIPVLRMIATPLPELEARAEHIANAIGHIAKTELGEAMVGGGSLPESTLPTRLVVIKLGGEAKVQDVTQKLREHKPPVIGRASKNALILDPRSVFPEEDEALITAVREILAVVGKSRKEK
jgi:L-seryl-tRNA(Ser) seleniumtransferase